MILKKLMAFVVSFAMVMSIVSTVGISASGNEAQVVAKIGNSEYYSLAEAMVTASEAYAEELVTVTLTANSGENFTLNTGIVKLETGGFDYTGVATVEGAVLIADCEIQAECTQMGKSSDGTLFGYTGLNIGVEMVDGAQVRIGDGVDENGKITGDGSGLRFIAAVDRADTLAALAYGNGDGYAENYEIGVAITAEEGESEVLIPATKWQENGSVFTVALTNLVESNYNRRFSATAYVEIEGVRFDNEISVTRSIYQVASGLLIKDESMSQDLLNVLNAYVNQTGVRLTLSDSTTDAALYAATGDAKGAYSGDAVFKVGKTTYHNGVYKVELEAIGKSVINTALFNKYVRINNNNSKVAPLTTITDNGNGKYTIAFDYADMHNATAVITEALTLENGKMTAYVPEGVAFYGSAKKLQLLLTNIDDDDSAVEAGEGEDLSAFDIHVSGIATDNTTPIVITLTEIAQKGLNIGNLKLYHVENGKQVAMEQVGSVAELTKHNQFTYEPLDGTITVALASFSEVALVADAENEWNGDVAESFADGTGTKTDPYLIANADQLAYFNNVISNNEEYGDKHYKLTSDINIGTGNAFYPIGYWCEGEGANAAGEVWYTYGGAFSGTFDGNGHVIKNIYQNTWQLNGDYGNGYWDAAMGLFGYVHGGTVKNLTVDNFSSDGEYTPTGVIAAYAVNSTFENIAITNCNPRVYNTGNGGIVGIGGNSDDPEDYKLTFTNITIDNTNKISALWGSWDVACGGLVGMFRGAGHAYMTNCHVAAQIDVYNDVCGNYQYYWYRYSGMMIGTNKNMITDDKGYTVPETSKFHAENCTVHFGDWNDYYYCELVANSLASYTHDHQFSRLEEVKEVSGTTITYLDGTTGAVPTSGRYNYVVVNGAAATENATCYHFVDGAVWNHEDAGTEEVNGETVPVEDKTIVYLPFNQLFTGYGWGVKHIPIYDDGTPNPFAGVTILDREVADSEVKFETKFTGDFLYRVGNQNTVALGSLFKAVEDATINNSGVIVTIDKVDESMDVSGAYVANTTDWTKGTIQFGGAGVVKVTIQDYEYCTPTVLYLEVVDATNVTSYSGLGNRNSVLLNDITMTSGGTYYLSGGATLYGNGFTFDIKNGAYAGVEYDYQSYVIGLVDSNLDNVKIEGAVYTTYGGTKDKEYSRPAVFSSGDCTITNCYISNCASPVRSGGDLKLINTTLKGGNYANLDLRSGHLLLDNVTTINQVKGNDTAEDGTVVVGLGIVVYQEGGDDFEIIIRNGLTQYNYLSKAQADAYITGTQASLVTGQVFSDTFSSYQYIDADNVKWVNTGVVSMNNSFAEANLVDERSNTTGYSGTTAEVTVLGQTRDCFVYSVKPSTDDEVKVDAPSYESVGQGIIKPSVDIVLGTNEDSKDDETPERFCVKSDENTINIQKPEEDEERMTFDPFILVAEKCGKTLDYTVTVDDEPYSEGDVIEITETKDYTVVYTYNDSYNYTVEESGEPVSVNVQYTKTIMVSVKIKEPDAKNAIFTFGANGIEYNSKEVVINDKTYIMPNVSNVVDGKIGSTTVSGTTVYYPITEMYTSDGKTEHSSDWYACFPIFKDALQIIDYADGGKSETDTTYNQTTVTTVDGIPSTLKATNPTSAFLYSMNATNYPPPTDPTAVSGAVCYTCNRNGLTSGNTRDEMTIIAEYTYTDNAGKTYYYYVGYHCAKQTSSSCLVEGTPITLADGTTKAVEDIVVGDMVLIFNHVTGKTEAMPVIFNNHQDQEAAMYEVVHLNFSNGEEVKIVSSHGFFDMTEMKYVYITDENYEEFIGHDFYALGDGNGEVVTLTDAYVEEEYTRIFCPVSYFHMNSFANGFLNTPNIPGDITGLVNYFEYDSDLKYNEEKMQEDIEKYGLYTYDDFKDYISYEAYLSSPSVYLKVAVGKGMITFEEILDVIEYLLSGSLIQ